MKPRIRSTKLLAMALAVGMLAAGWAAWGTRPAAAIIIVNSKTGLFTLTQGQAARAHVVNTGEHGIIIVNTKVVGGDGATLAEFPEHRLEPSQAASFEFAPRLAVEQRLPVRVELKVEGARGTAPFIPTLEVFDTATGRTGFVLPVALKLKQLERELLATQSEQQGFARAGKQRSATARASGAAREPRSFIRRRADWRDGDR